MDDLDPCEAHLATPPAEVCAGIIKRVAEFDEHVERHQQPLHIFSTGIIDQCFDGHQRAARWQCVVGGSEQVHLFLQIPIVQNHAHCNDVCLW